MKLIDKLKDTLADRAAEAIASSLTVVLAWAAYQIAPAILPAIEDVVSKRFLLALLATSSALNVIFFVATWYSSKSDDLRLKYGVYWDKQKNPHCPSCKKPISGYASYQFHGKGYYCKPCNKVFPLTDAQGNTIEPAQVLSEL
ncbi:hypothetical protein K7B09_12880 [Thermomonas sp. RSS23]|uniref:Transposase n=1 Tax=Thermomonas beijingensis TaxID=2872701 RepID=A0ABS7THK2_9GAMM|nr:hypothetical protein [Thermomonas beijingensis]MBZ4187216.1 hypothetical protein [Thermomonas beijingensis]